jgi:hypothetical protein
MCTRGSCRQADYACGVISCAPSNRIGCMLVTRALSSHTPMHTAYASRGSHTISTAKSCTHVHAVHDLIQVIRRRVPNFDAAKWLATRAADPKAGQTQPPQTNSALSAPERRVQGSDPHEGNMLASAVGNSGELVCSSGVEHACGASSRACDGTQRHDLVLKQRDFLAAGEAVLLLFCGVRVCVCEMAACGVTCSSKYSNTLVCRRRLLPK